jgi:hypothetical protein
VHYFPEWWIRSGGAEDPGKRRRRTAVAVLSTLEMGTSYTMFRRRSDDFAVLDACPGSASITISIGTTVVWVDPGALSVGFRSTCMCAQRA